MYSSGKHNKLTDDPTPWEVDDDRGFTAYGSRADALNDGFTEVRWAPDLEHDLPLINPANPILTSIRTGDNMVRGVLDMLGEDAREWWNPEVVLDEHIGHARRVLSILSQSQGHALPLG